MDFVGIHHKVFKCTMNFTDGKLNASFVRTFSDMYIIDCLKERLKLFHYTHPSADENACLRIAWRRVYTKKLFSVHTQHEFCLYLFYLHRLIFFTFVTINYAKQPCGKIIRVSVLRDIVNRGNNTILTTYYK